MTGAVPYRERKREREKKERDRNGVSFFLRYIDIMPNGYGIVR